MTTVFPDLEQTLGRSAVHVLQEWPEIQSSLDDSQMSALRQAITKGTACLLHQRLFPAHTLSLA